MSVCAVPECTRTLHPRNSTGVCRWHNHRPGICLCSQCTGKPLPKTLDPGLTQKQTVETIKMLREGWGVEDIALKMGVPVTGTRSVLKRLHGLGVFEQPTFFRKVTA